MLHQTIIGLEAKKQMEKIGEYPDIVIGCVGGGSNFAGLALPFILDKINGKKVQVIAVEPASCPTMTKGLLFMTSAIPSRRPPCCRCTLWDMPLYRPPSMPVVCVTTAWPRSSAS